MRKFLTKYGTHIALMLGMIGVVAMIGATTPDQFTHPHTGPEYAKTSAMILAMSRKSGGSGVILSSSPKGSIVLTNKHVCEVIQNGGIVKTTKHEAKVRLYKFYTKHDLCMISVRENLGVNTQVAATAPELYSESVSSGHPALLPSISSKGIFTEQMVVKIMIGMKDCDGTEKDNDVLYCIFMGKKPILQDFDAQVTSSLIMAGSSGSAVFDRNGDIAALVFAGSPDGLSYGFLVPHSYVHDFVTNSKDYKWKRVSNKTQPSSFMRKVVELRERCAAFSAAIPGCNELAFQSIWSR